MTYREIIRAGWIRRARAYSKVTVLEAQIAEVLGVDPISPIGRRMVARVMKTI